MDLRLFQEVRAPMPRHASRDAIKTAHRIGRVQGHNKVFVPTIDDRTLDVFARAINPDDPFELRDLWLGRVECEMDRRHIRPELASKWSNSRVLRTVDAQQVLTSCATVRFVKELFNWFFRDDLYGKLRSSDNIILSSGSVDEEEWGLPETLKSCIRYAISRDWYGYSDSRGREPAREAIAAYECTRMQGAHYHSDNVAITMGGTFAISSLADFILLNSNLGASPALCGIPNYPPLVESVSRRHSIELVPLPCHDGQVSLQPLIDRLSPTTPMVMLQTVANPTGASVSDGELKRLVQAAAPSTMIVLDECHEWLGPTREFDCVRASSNIVRVFSVSKAWSAPGLKIGWILADPNFIAEYYEYASTTFGGPPSFFYTFIEILARMERWMISGIERPGAAEIAELESSYQLDVQRLDAAYRSYCEERICRERALQTTRDATVVRLSEIGGLTIIPPQYSINMTIECPDWDDSYRCFREILEHSNVALFPGILTFCFSSGSMRVTTARRWSELSTGVARIESQLAVC